ncbi:dTDP-4-dehydrorhamnose reductase [Actinophytocola xanthii]|uniref:dTDP-4-dehydrorhamnose reductase n=1 Tax=Actinophytocola xanthii TaxID=1912961 RepID=A0A1Q8CSE4_9PSEU|nr:dTDP-4-dehydrorhamnose reductase [Actinophytocola xanthii]OLF17237.1 dTDP-4-dehydrorhamnose reductase [Actinophytocola xanthii]
MRVYLTGADGMLGTALTDAVRTGPSTQDWLLHGVSRADFDIADRRAVLDSVAAFAPDVVVHAAAHAIVDDCETDPRLAMRVNVAGTHNVAHACRRSGARLVYLSSDYVFDGATPPEGGYRETDTPSPLSVYGLTKLAGERISQTVPAHLLVRTSWLFGGSDERTDTVLATVRGAARGAAVELIDDQFSCPTYTVDLAAALVFLLARGTTGTVHAANTGSASWYQVAQVALATRHDTPTLLPVPLADRPFLGTRPRDSALNTDLLASLGHPMPHWTDAVTRFCRELGTVRT